MAQLRLELKTLGLHNPGPPEVQTYDLSQVAQKAGEWDRVVKGTHLVNCWYNYACNFNIFVKDGVVVREEQVGSYPPQNDPNVPDFNPRGCQKGVCYSNRMYDPARLKYPLKRIGARGEGKWQRVSWDQALSEIADIFLDVLSTEGNEPILRMGGTMAGIGSEGLGFTSLLKALGIAGMAVTNDNGDEHPGAALTWGKIVVADSADNWFHSDMILIWGGNPAYTHIANFSFITAARYNGTKVVAITPDYSPSCPFADVWLPVNTGSDAALALAMARVIVKEKLYKADFLREQTDLSLLVREDTRKFLREKDLKRGGREDVFFIYDLKGKKVVEAPYKSLALDGLVPSLDGEYEVRTQAGKVKVKPAFEYLKARLEDYTLERASKITGVSPQQIEQLAREMAKAKGVVNITTSNWGRHYHGDLIQRSIILLFYLCGHIGRKGASYNAYPMFMPDSTVGLLVRRTFDMMIAARAADPRIAKWEEQGYTEEMIVYEFMKDMVNAGLFHNHSILYHRYAGLDKYLSQYNLWDPSLKRPAADYLKEALEKKWQVVPSKEPKIIWEAGGSFLRRSRSTQELIQNFLPKLKLLFTLDWRMGSTAFYSDYILPAAAWYEKYSLFMGMPTIPYLHLVQKAVEPVGESKTEWEFSCLFAKKLEERAKARGVLTFKDKDGREVRLDNLFNEITSQGLYAEADEEALARDYYLNSDNLEKMEWEELKEKGIARFTSVGKLLPGTACDLKEGEPVTPLTFHTDKKVPYPTLTRRAQFYLDHDWFLELGEEFPCHKDIPKIGGDYPLQVTGGHARWSIHSCWTENPILLRLQRGEPIMFMNKGDAQARGIEDGDKVEVHNDVSSFQIQVVVAPSVKPGQVVIYHNWENYQFAGKKHFKSVMAYPLNPAELVGAYGHVHPRGQFHGQPGPADRGTRVEVRKV